jgi:hypothetical protein
MYIYYTYTISYIYATPLGLYYLGQKPLLVTIDHYGMLLHNLASGRVITSIQYVLYSTSVVLLCVLGGIQPRIQHCGLYCRHVIAGLRWFLLSKQFSEETSVLYSSVQLCSN